MFKPFLTLTVAAAIIALASPAFAVSASFQLTVTVPPHLMPVQAENPGIEKTAAQSNFAQTVQKEQIVRNNEHVTVQSIVVL